VLRDDELTTERISMLMVIRSLISPEGRLFADLKATFARVDARILRLLPSCALQPARDAYMHVLRTFGCSILHKLPIDEKQVADCLYTIHVQLQFRTATQGAAVSPDAPSLDPMEYLVRFILLPLLGYPITGLDAVLEEEIRHLYPPAQLRATLPEWFASQQPQQRLVQRLLLTLQDAIQRASSSSLSSLSSSALIH
jgi:hypothetical protein